MAIIKEKRLNQKERIKLEIDQEIYSEINNYCERANISNIEHFFEEAARFVFSKDVDWKKHLKSKRK